jgi:hypothetical protein
METLILEEQKSEAVEEKLTRKEFGERRKSDIILAQKMAKLEQMKGDVKREHSEFLKQRVAMKKRVYTDVLILLESKSYNEAGLKYFRLAKIFSEKRDLRTSSLMILLHGLALIKSNESTKKIRSNVNSYLSSLGLNKQLVKDTYYLSLIDFILDVISNNMDKYLLKIKELLGILPLFVEEKQLIEIDI